MTKTQQFIKSFYHIKLLAAFRVKPMGKAISYLFYLSLILLLPVLASSLFTFLFGSEPPSIVSGVSSGIFIVIFLPFIYFLIVFVLFIVVSGFAALALLYTRLSNRRADYKQLWNVAALAITAPAFVVVLVESFIFSSTWFLYVFIIASTIYIGSALKYLPQKK
ncbi:DUF1189 domain-containing protein [Halobacillus sp. A1]|uniref:DUF1189 family protein n=1 Tax=Halobacillus sp. A1 TaxID=2880262 RepID=UPI0020A6BAF5|nr:DUF1189 family protein [Halobacillus sp. A1]MCP3030328.1 DUF1189 domain-containing protein [Halobacillus sp. A1]